MSLTAKEADRDYHQHSATAKKGLFAHEDYFAQRVALLQDQNSRLEAELALARNKFRKIADLQSKIDLVLGHNTRLIKENEFLKDQLEARDMHPDGEARLLDQIASLTEACSRIEHAKELELNDLRQQLREALQRKQSSARATENMEYYQSQIRKLKELLNHRSEQVATVKHELTLELERSQEEIIYLTNELQHQQSLNLLSLNQLRDSNELALERLRNAHNNSMTLTKGTFEAECQKLRKDLADRTLEVEQLRERISSNSQKGRQEKQASENQIRHAQLEMLAKEEFNRKVLADKEEELRLQHEQQLMVIQATTQQKIQAAEQAAQVLKKALDAMGEQSARRQLEQSRQRLTQAHQEQQREQQLRNLQQQAKQREGILRGQMQCLKAKLGGLRETDLRILVESLSSQVEQLSARAERQQEVIASKNEAIAKGINMRIGLRKSYEQISGSLKQKYRDLKVKFNIMVGQNREQMASMATRLQLNSATILNEANAKAKSSEALELESARLQELLIQRDEKIKQLEQDLIRDKQAAIQARSLHQVLIEQASARGQALRQQVAEQIQILKAAMAKQKQASEDEVKQLLRQAEQDSKVCEGLRKKNEQLSMTLSGKDYQIKEVRKRMKEQEADFSARCGFLESAQIQSSAAVQEQKNKLKVIMSKNEVNLKVYFEDKQKKMEKDLEDLRGLLSARAQESLRLQRRIRQLEHKVEAGAGALEEQGELTKKIISMGRYQNNLMNTIEMMRAFRTAAAK